MVDQAGEQGVARAGDVAGGHIGVVPGSRPSRPFRQLWVDIGTGQCKLTAMTQATELADATASKDPAVGLAAVASLRALLESLEALQVDNARTHGWSWQQIAEALGVSKQAVHKKHGGGRRLLARRER